MYGNNFRAPKVDIHKFSMIPRADIPRSTFRVPYQHKTTFSASNLIPVMIHEVLPGDTWSVKMAAFCRLATPVYPIMDNMDLESWFFFVPNRILWSHWVNFMGEQPASPSDSISYTIPTTTTGNGGFQQWTMGDYFGMPVINGPIGATTITVNVLPFRAYNMIWNQWFRDENLQAAQGFGAANTVYDLGDGPDPLSNYAIMPINKRHDYFTSCLPWTQKAATPIGIPLSGNATVKTSTTTGLYSGATIGMFMGSLAGGSSGNQILATGPNNAGPAVVFGGTTAPGASTGNLFPTNLYADLTTATSTTINALRLAFQTQKLLERDARGGTRYQELLMSHFGVHPLDARLQRPEYLGGGITPINVAPVPQTSATGLTGGTSPIGTLSAVGTAQGNNHGFHASFTEHGWIMGLVAARSDQVYQYGMHRQWTRSTRYDFYWPAFAMLGEQAVRNDEIYTQGLAAGVDANAFGYQERWAEYRYFPSRVSGFFRSYSATPLDAWHLAAKYTTLPLLNSTFIQEPLSTTLVRNLAAGVSAGNQQLLADFYFDIRCARPMPLYSVPGMIDRF